ncbi:unnamed protein product [Phytomonas sp. EM1]|nr:unnamed protein product [Phytomonas sp. EM1]|eukprot:CCW65575.1 unnamed protein product [Phytomonas sp. isolate EM1]
MSSRSSLQNDGSNVDDDNTIKVWENAEAPTSSMPNVELVDNPPVFSLPTDTYLNSPLEEDGDEGVQISKGNLTAERVEEKGLFYKEEDDVEIQMEMPETLDNVGHEVRQYRHDEPPHPLSSHYVALEDASTAFPRNDASDVMESSEHVSNNAGTLTFRLQNPSQGVQAENVSPPEAESLEDNRIIEQENMSASIPSNFKNLTMPTTPKNEGLSMHSLSLLRSLSTDIEVSNKGFADITLTFYPMGFQTRLTQPVYNTNAFSKEGIAIISEYNGFSATSTDRKEWILIARDLFEAIAHHICMHPQSFVVYHQDKRIHFNSLMFLETERGRSAGREAHATGLSGGINDPVAVMRTEPLWLSIAFSDPARIMPTGVIDSTIFSLSDDQLVLEGAADSYTKQFQATPVPSTALSLANVPQHLAVVQRDEYLAKCILVRKEKVNIDPHVLVEGRRQGFTFDEVIQSINKHERGVAGNEAVMTAVSIVQAPTLLPKAFLGGYRVRQDPKRLLLHASTQIFMADLDYSPHNGKKRAEFISNELRSRQTQTYGKSRSTQTRREGCAQTPRPDLLLDNTHDVLVVARPYFSAEALLKLRIEKIIILQKMYRQWKARQICRELYAAETERQLQTAARQRIEEAAVRARANLEKLRRMNPHRANDFGVLKEELLLWRSNKAKSINQDESLSAEQKREALLSLTKEEVKLLQDLEQHRQVVQQNKQGQRLVRVLEKAAAAKIWGGIPVTTPGTLRAAELRNLFYNLTNNDFDASSRMDVLLHIKWTVKEFPDSNEAKELCQLIDREADLINRGWKSASLTELRKRITNIFRRFILDPEYNPEMVRYNDSSVARRKAETLGLDKITSSH